MTEMRVTISPSSLIGYSQIELRLANGEVRFSTFAPHGIALASLADFLTKWVSVR